ILESLARVADRLRRGADDVLLRQLELELAVDGAGRQKDVEPSARRVLEGFGGAVDVLPIGAGERAHQRAVHSSRGGGNRLEIAGRGDRNTQLRRVDSDA